MVLEWLRRNDPKLDEHLRTYLFSQGSIIRLEEVDTGKAEPGGAPPAGDASLGIGSLKGKV
jgi:hypothetical protein